MAYEGFIKLISSIIPNNLNPKQWISRNKDIQGSDQNFAALQDLVDFHPFKMQRGMKGTVQDYPSVGKSTDFKMMSDPFLMTDGNENSLVTLDNFGTYWQEISTTDPVFDRVYSYAPDGPGGGSPIYPYTPAEEVNWSPEYDDQKSHRWLRFRDDDVDDNVDGVFDNWTVPIAINAFSSGDYVENRFQRYALSKPDQDLTLLGDLEQGRFYVITVGQLTFDGEAKEIGYRFTYDAGVTVVFGVGATVIETNLVPPRTVNSLPNNEPVGWDDVPPVGTDILWMITGQKSVYGQLKTNWVLRKIEEKPNYVRYSYTAEPNPNTLCTTTESAADGTPVDTDLINGGWLKTFSDQTFMAYRDDVSPGVYTTWQVEKISGESGEYIDRVFKLYPVNMDPDNPLVQAPTTRTPSNEGWYDVPLVETAIDINFTSSARKFFDGTLKTPWSPPIPYTGKSTYQDIIITDSGDEFKIDPNVVPVVIEPSLITLTNELYKGAERVWESAVTMTFKWYRVFDNGTVYPADASSEPTAISGFAYVPSSGTPATSGYFFDNQRATITPDVVTGKAVFRCVATLETDADPIIFEEEISIVDISDGIDAKSLVVSPDVQLFIYDTVALAFVPLDIILRAYSANLGSPTFYWYHWNGASWDALTTGTTYTATAATYFTADASAEEARFAVSTHPTDPDAADYIATFSDFLTIGKSSAAGVGSPGENSVIALLDNESHTVVIDNTVGTPFAGEIGSGGKAITAVEVWDGITKLSLAATGEDVDVVIASDNPNITFGIQYGTQASDPEKYAEVFVNTWTADEISAVCIITLTYASKVYTKQFSISSTADAPGAILLDIDATGGFNWTTADRTDKTTNGNLYDSNILQTTGYVYRWLVNGVATALPNLGSATAAFHADNREVIIARTVVGSSATITCQTYPSGSTPVAPIENTVGFRARDVKFTDVLDNQMKIAWTDNAATTNGDKIPDGTAPSALPVTPSVSVWYLSTDAYWITNQPEFQCIAEETTAGWVWTYPQDMRGEQGDQGPNGDYFFNMFKVDGNSLPASNASINTMIAQGWSRTPATVGIVWATQGRFNGENYPIVGGYPDPDTGVPEDDWSQPTKLTGTSGTDGTDGTTGIDGDNGWSPKFAIVSDGDSREVLQLVDYVGGEGTKPSITNPTYISSSGFTTSKASAQNIKGVGVRVQVGGSTWTQGGPSAGDIWINKV